MEQNPFDSSQSNPPRRRRKRSKWQDFKEAYLPVIILAAAAILIIVFIAGSISRANEGKQTDPSDPSGTSDIQNASMQELAQSLMDQAKQRALVYDYVSAMDILTSFTGDITTIDGMVELYNEYGELHSQLVPFTQASSVPNLSFNTLIADIAAAEADPESSDSYSRSYVTSSEFSAILESLYEDGYVLVSLYDLAEKSVASDGTVSLSSGKLYLPEGKKPIVLTLSGGDYSIYTTDNGSAGFPSKMILDSSGNLTNEMVASDGSVSTGNYDLIPILSAFLREHPDFSYHGARATIALSGCGDVFGYKPDDPALVPIIDTIKNEGYDFACYTYDVVEYGKLKASQVEADLSQWMLTMKPVLGEVDILVYPYGSDFSDATEYSGDVFDVLMNNGLCYFVQTETSTPSWAQTKNSYFRISRRWVNGTNLSYRQTYLKDLFDPNEVLDPLRGEVPQQ